ncbi:hypothetical protein ADL05_18540 [Nocardiopsis sp. NRRL B-16309]|nr:hypothetical protein ADL05_18540 [Nocardiopsis sp. NRRL B-16309]
MAGNRDTCQSNHFVRTGVRGKSFRLTRLGAAVVMEFDEEVITALIGDDPRDLDQVLLIEQGIAEVDRLLGGAAVLDRHGTIVAATVPHGEPSAEPSQGCYGPPVAAESPDFVVLPAHTPSAGGAQRLAHHQGDEVVTQEVSLRRSACAEVTIDDTGTEEA